jgi:hypothetical protein
MPRYMLLSYQLAEGGPSQAEFAEEHAKWQKYVQDLTEAGVFVANEGLGRTEVATTVRVRDGETQITDGPFAETKEYLAGFFLIETTDLDDALGWAARMPGAGYGSVEVRPLWGGAGQESEAGQAQAEA